MSGESELSKEAIEEARREAENFAKEDSRLQLLRDMRNSVESVTYQCEDKLNRYGDKLAEIVRSELLHALANLRDIIKHEDNVEVIKDRLRDFTLAAAQAFAPVGGPGDDAGNAEDE